MPITNHPLALPSGRILVGLYSDVFDISLMAITDDNGKTWQVSTPLVGGGNVQPSLVRKKDGTIVAMHRENGLGDKIRLCESKDDGKTWGAVTNSELPNPGSSVDVIATKAGNWVLVYNDTTKGRHSLAVSLSEDEGRTWKWTRHLEKREAGQGAFHYPSIIEGSDGNFHVLYSYFIDQPHNGEAKGKSIRYATFNKEWVKQE